VWGGVCGEGFSAGVVSVGGGVSKNEPRFRAHTLGALLQRTGSTASGIERARLRGFRSKQRTVKQQREIKLLPAYNKKKRQRRTEGSMEGENYHHFISNQHLYSLGWEKKVTQVRRELDRKGVSQGRWGGVEGGTIVSRKHKKEHTQATEKNSLERKNKSSQNVLGEKELGGGASNGKREHSKVYHGKIRIQISEFQPES